MRGMDVSHILDGLNNAQREAVTAAPGPMLVLAGAGSGKTRVLVHRMAWMIEVEGVSPFSLMAVTFTNKASKEMRGRVEQLQGSSPHGMWVGTFHGIAHRLLRAHWKEADLPQHFQILDSDDQFRMIRAGAQGAWSWMRHAGFPGRFRALLMAVKMRASARSMSMPVPIPSASSW